MKYITCSILKVSTFIDGNYLYSKIVSKISKMVSKLEYDRGNAGIKNKRARTIENIV